MIMSEASSTAIGEGYAASTASDARNEVLCVYTKPLSQFVDSFGACMINSAGAVTSLATGTDLHICIADNGFRRVLADCKESTQPIRIGISDTICNMSNQNSMDKRN